MLYHNSMVIIIIVCCFFFLLCSNGKRRTNAEILLDVGKINKENLKNAREQHRSATKINIFSVLCQFCFELTHTKE